MGRSTLETTPLAEIVRQDFRAGAILDGYHLDFCCGGALSLADACEQRGIDVQRVIVDIEALHVPEREYPDNPIALISHIITCHHNYVRQSLPAIQEHLAKVVAAHGGRHPELAFIESEFARIATELQQHLLKEEQVLFPYVIALCEAVESRGALPPDMFGTIQNPIRVMEIEHQEASDRMVAIRELSRGYTAPEDACDTYRLVFEELKAFAGDLRVHVELEDNVLFPKAVALEEQATKLAQGLKSHRWEPHVSGR
jgi:regulator of cell morphogenesis and NO signaling